MCVLEAFCWLCQDPPLPGTPLEGPPRRKRGSRRQPQASVARQRAMESMKVTAATASTRSPQIQQVCIFPSCSFAAHCCRFLVLCCLSLCRQICTSLLCALEKEECCSGKRCHPLPFLMKVLTRLKMPMRRTSRGAIMRRSASRARALPSMPSRRQTAPAAAAMGAATAAAPMMATG